jgi:hypothetical protein
MLDGENFGKLPNSVIVIIPRALSTLNYQKETRQQANPAAGTIFLSVLTILPSDLSDLSPRK